VTREKVEDAKDASDSGTARAAIQARAVMQRRHLWIGFAMTTAIGVEVAGAAGLIGGGLLPWEWGERLWGRTDGPALVVQVAIALVVLALLSVWPPSRQPGRGVTRRVRTRIAALLPAAVIVVAAVAMVWSAELGAREAGGVVTALAALLVMIGAVGWLVGLRRLRVLFPFGLADARGSGYGNLAAVRRAQLIGGPAGAVGGIAVVAGAMLVAPGVVATEDFQTTDPLALTGAPPAVSGPPAWTMELPAAHEGRPSSVWATAGGLVVEERHGVRGVDPRSGELRWHWRDEAYQRVAGTVTDQGRTVVLGLEYVGEGTGRDRVVALDTATGEVRWDHFDDDLVAAMARVVVAPDQGDWFLVPEPEVTPGSEQDPPVNLLMVGSDDGEVRWQATEQEDCRFTAVNADATDVVVATQRCFDQESTALSCLVSGLAPADGAVRWTWPADPTDRSIPECQTTPTPELVFVSYQQESQPHVVALDPRTGQEVWTAVGEDATGLSAGPVVVGDAVVGLEPSADGSGAVLVIRAAADGQLRGEVPLPDGQPIGLIPVDDQVAALSHYRPETTEVLLLEVDVPAAEVRSETVVTTSPPDSAFRRVTVTAGPEALVLDALVAAGQQPGEDDYTLRLHGW
jgi:outer membrane protein assembly factor BamB